MSNQATLEKKEGNSGPCYMCNETMYCRLVKSEKYGDKLQWQNEDGKSHWLPNRGGCRKVNGDSPSRIYKSKEMDLSNFKPETLSETEVQIWTDIVKKVTDYTLLAQKELQAYPELTNPALKGLISKECFTVLNQINERKSKQ